MPWQDPGPDAARRCGHEGVARRGRSRRPRRVDPTDPTTIDISPGAYGHNTLGANDGKGWEKNPVTGQPYAAQVVPTADFARVMAEFWADGPKSETPPGHWNTLANAVSDSPGFERRLFGKGEPLDPLAWDVHVYLALNGAVHDAAIAAWDIKRRTVTVRPISLIRWMGGEGAVVRSEGPRRTIPRGCRSCPGSSRSSPRRAARPGERHAHLASFVGQIAVRDWLGEPGDRAYQVSGVGWVRAVEWITYQRRTFVTPGLSRLHLGPQHLQPRGRRGAREPHRQPLLPGRARRVRRPEGHVPRVREGARPPRCACSGRRTSTRPTRRGSRASGGAFTSQPDDFAGRRVGHRVGLDAVALASKYFDGASSAPLR